ncbi:MAG TPA: ABC transporter permease [Verrucomicrobiota bacterium]|nr:hypothetical protein [Verrucomicrobiales bacterium]HRI15035.1 ABC transporter permease [Verrucomicrobiota bacterium]
MTVLPVVARELRVAARRPWTYWGRLVAGGIAVTMSAWMLLAGRRVGFENNGTPLFFMIAVMAFGFTLLGGLLYSADCVSGEKRDGTLGLLFLTDLRGWDVTLGKLAATSLGGLYGLLSVMPLMALPLLMGGVMIGDYARMVLLLVTTLFCSLAAGLLASVLTTDVRRSVFLTFLFLMVIVTVAPLAYETITWFAARSARRSGWVGVLVESWTPLWLQKATPFEAFSQVHGTSYASAPWNYWCGVIYTGVIGIAALAYSSWRLPRVWQEKGLGDPRTGFRGWLDRRRFSGLAGKDRFRTRWLEDNPIAWLSGRHWTRRWLVWFFLSGSLLGAWLLGTWSNEVDWWKEPAVLMVITFGMHLVLKFWVANEAPRQFLDDRRTGALELLLSTPLTVAEILSGRWLALWRQFGGPVVAVLLLDVAGLWLLVASRNDAGEEGEMIGVWLSAMTVLALDLWALGWDGLWIGLTSRSRTATTWMLARILVLPWLAWFAYLTFVGSMTQGFGGIGTFETLLMLWLAFSVGNSLFWGLRARLLVTKSFREAATKRTNAWSGWRRKRRADLPDA